MASENNNKDRTSSGQNLHQGAGIFAKRFQKSLNRAQEKVLQKLGKTMETKDEQFEQCFLNLNKQQVDGSKLSKDVRAYFNAVKAMHESSKRLSQTLKDVYEPDWNGGEDLSVIMESEDLLWNDYEEKLTDQIVRTMENYTSQFPEVKERVAKRGRKLVDYDSARHHLEALQSAKKKDDAKTVKAEEEFNKAQNVFEEINNELREELPVLYQSRIGCYVTVFQNISNLRDVFYKEMSVLNHELYNIMKKLETQHSGKAFIIKGLNSSASKSKKRKSLVISNPIPCNTAFPADHMSVHSSTDASGPSAPLSHTHHISEEPEQPEVAGTTTDVPAKDVTTSDSEQEDLSSGGGGADTPKRQSSVCDSESSNRSTGSQNPEDAGEEETTTVHSDDSGMGDPRSEGTHQEDSGRSEGTHQEDSGRSESTHQEDSGRSEGTHQEDSGRSESTHQEDSGRSEGTHQEAIGPSDSEECNVLPSQEQQESTVADPPPSQQAKSTKPPPVPAPRLSSRHSERRLVPPPPRPAAAPAPATAAAAAPAAAPATAAAEASQAEEKQETPAEEDQRMSENCDDSLQKPPGFLYTAVALQSQAASEDGLLQFEEGEVILVLKDTHEEEGLVTGLREESWKQHGDVKDHCGVLMEKLLWRMHRD